MKRTHKFMPVETLAFAAVQFIIAACTIAACTMADCHAQGNSRTNREARPNRLPLALKQGESREWNNEAIIDEVLLDPKVVTKRGEQERLVWDIIGSKGPTYFRFVQVISDTEAHITLGMQSKVIGRMVPGAKVYPVHGQRCSIEGGDFASYKDGNFKNNINGQTRRMYLKNVGTTIYETTNGGSNKIPVLEVIAAEEINSSEDTVHLKKLPFGRTWTSRGQHRLWASFYKFEAGNVTLIDEQHKKLTLPIDALCEADQKHIKALATLKKSAMRHLARNPDAKGKQDVSTTELLKRYAKDWVKENWQLYRWEPRPAGASLSLPKHSKIPNDIIGPIPD